MVGHQIWIPKTSIVSRGGSLLSVGSKSPIFSVVGGDMDILLASIHCVSLSPQTVYCRHEQEYWFLCFFIKRNNSFPWDYGFTSSLTILKATERRITCPVTEA